MDEKEDILSAFYSARQKEDEVCAHWSCRLEDILSKAVHKGLVPSTQSDEMLRKMFFKGLWPTMMNYALLLERLNWSINLHLVMRKLYSRHQLR